MDDAVESIEESEQLVTKLDKEILDWNALKKLKKRDTELEEVQQIVSDLVEDLSQELHNTEIELEKNREKQEENGDEEMVDEKGNKVDI